MLLNMEELLYRIDGDKNLLKELISIFIQQVSEYSNVIAQAIEVQDLEKTISVAHALKGMAANMAAVAIAKCAHRIEMAARDGRQEDILNEYAELQIQIGRTLEIIKGHTGY